MALFEREFGNQDYSDILKQVRIVRKRMRDEKTGLYYHGYDSSKSMYWADKETGLSRSFWLRSIGWFSIALADLIEIIPEKAVQHEIGAILRDLMASIAVYADPETEMYYQVVDQGSREGNYLESSGSSMVAYAMMKGARLGILDVEFAEKGKKTFDGIIRTCLKAEGEKKSAVLVAEGKKESMILQAEADKQATILAAEAQKERMLKEAEGRAEAIRKVQEANADGIRMVREAGADEAVLTLKSLEAFAQAADGRATKIIIPSEIQGIAGLAASLREIAGNTYLTDTNKSSQNAPAKKAPAGGGYRREREPGQGDLTIGQPTTLA